VGVKGLNCSATGGRSGPQVWN